MSEQPTIKQMWTLETVATSCGICHKIGPLGEPNGRRPNHACIYDDGGRLDHPTPHLLAAARKMMAAEDLYDACMRFVEKGHHDTCSAALLDGYPCDCGCDAAAKAVAKAGGE